MTRLITVRADSGDEARSATTDRWHAPAILAIAGALALGIGLLVYVADRDAGHAALIPTAAALSTGPLFGVLAQWLPSFVHPLAFSLFTAAARATTGSPAYRACVAWWAVNVAFEVAQHPRVSAPLAESLVGTFGDEGAARRLATYFLRGSFDAGDIVAATLGASAAAIVLLLVHRMEARDEH